MIAGNLVSRLQQRGVRLFVQDGRLRINAPSGLVGEEDVAQLREHREAIIALLQGAPDTADCTIARVEREGSLACSPAQSRLWLVQKMTGAPAAYNLPAAIRLVGSLDVAVLESSLATIVERHESLRCCFITVEGEPRLTVQPAGSWRLPVEAVGYADLTERMRVHAAQAFDLKAGPLFDARLLKVSEDEHLLLLNMHHIVSDGWSMGVLTRELCELYRAGLDGRPARLPELPVQYADFAAWQQQRLQSGELAAQCQYWKQHLAGAPALLPLPTDRVRPATRSERGATQGMALPPRLVSRLEDLAREERASLFMVLLTAFQLLLARLSGEDNIVVGTPVANRQRPEFEPLIGFFVNTLALRIRVDPDASFRELLRSTRDCTLGGYANQDVPFEQVVEALKPPRSLSHTPLFQVMFALQNAPAGDIALPGLQLQVQSADGRHAKFDLTLSLEEADGAVTGVMEYATELFEPETISGWIAEYVAILQSVSQNPDNAAVLLGATDEATANRQLAMGQGQQSVLLDADLLPARLARHVVQHGRRPAVVSGDQCLTYAQLDAEANRLAAALAAQGVAAEARVGLCLPRSAELIVGALASWKLGAAYVPLDTTYPIERLRHICEDAGIARVVAVEGTRDLCAQLGVDALYMEQLPHADNAIGVSPHPDQIAYVIYTSGSTGKPKGVMVSHGALRNLLRWHGRQYELAVEDRCSQIAQAGFDASVMEIWGCLAAGACLHIADAQTRAEPQRLGRWLRDQGITHAFMPTPLVEEMFLAQVAWPDSLRSLGCGGDQLRQGKPRDAAFCLSNLYGPTEAAVVTVAGDVAVDDNAVITIGRPTENTRAYVLDASLRPVPVGVPGELYLAGPSLARGYVGRPDLTAERFLPDPYAHLPGERMYRTGDRVRWMRSGCLQFLGRMDRQIKLRGFRIELGEVEAALARLPAVRAAAVELRSGPSGEAGLVGYVVLEPGSRLTAQDLRLALQRELPTYMVPTAWCTLDTLPLGATGKLDRRMFPAPQWQDAPAQDAAPRDEVESALVKIWSDLLRVPPMGIHDDFFALGGHSLLATRLLARIQAQWNLDLSLADVFQAPTIAGLATTIRTARQTGGAHWLPQGAITPTSRDSALPLSYAQQRLWFLAQLEPDSDSYHIPLVARLRGSLDALGLVEAFDMVARQHEILRARIVEIDGEPMQWFDHALPTLPIVDVTGAELDAAIEALLSRPFELDAQAPMRAALFRLDDGHHVLAMVVHHIVADGASLALFVRDLAALYQARAAGRPLQLAPLPIQYGDYAYWQREQLGEEGLRKQLDYWTGRLDGVPALLDLPLDRPRSPSSTRVSETVQLELQADLVSSLRALGQQHRATLFMTLLTGFKLLLARLSGQDDICVGTPISNRSRPELETVFGLFLGTLALRTSVATGASFTQLLGQVRETAVEGYARQDVPFERIVDALRLERDLSRHPLFQVFFNMPGAEDEAGLQLPGLEIQAQGMPEQGAKFDLTLYAHERGDSVALQLHYNAQLFERERMDELLRQLRAVLQQAVAAPETAVGAFSLRTPAAEQVLPDPAQDLDRQWHGSIPSLFVACVQSHPDRVALVDPRSSLTYRELDSLSNRLAHLLTGHAIGPGDVVALHATRRLELAVAMLSVLKSGAAFMILDAAYPEGRLIACLESAPPAAWIAVGEVPAGSAALDRVLANVRVTLSLGAKDTDLRAWPDAPIPDPGIQADSLSHIAFTSGSTGRPKAVAGRHGPFTHFLPWLRERFDLQPGRRYSVLSGLSHDPMQRDVLLPLMTGGTACFPDPELIVPGQLSQWMRDAEIHVANLTPAMVRVLADTHSQASLPQLRQAFVVGDVFTRADARKLKQLAPDCEIVSFYGATETQWALAHQIVTTHDRAPEVVPLGRGFPGVQLLLLNAHDQPAGIGEVAEVCIRSAHISSGYVEADQEGTARFRLWGGDDGDRIYRTGDLGRYALDGSVRGLGRADRQVSVRGFRVELGEIECRLAQLPGVSQTAVVHLPPDKLVAFVVTQDEQPDLASRVRTALRANLPDYMVPSQVLSLPQLPLTPNGKLDRAALLAMVPERGSEHQVSFVAPSTQAERCVARIVEAVLGRGPVGIDDDFFLVGGNSLSAMQVVSRLRLEFGAPLPVRQIFETPSVAGLAKWLEARQAQGGPDQHCIVRQRADMPAPLSFAQQRLWFLQRLQEDSSAYNMLLALRMRGQLDNAALRAAWTDLVARHASLRTVFDVCDGQAWQRVLPAQGGVQIEETSGGEADVNAHLQRLLARPFDLAAAPPVRVSLLRLADNDHVLAVSLHHIATDGWSMGVIAADLAALYAERCDGQPARLTPLSCEYPDYAAWQRSRLQGDSLDRLSRFWREHLLGQPPLLPLPTDRPRPVLGSHRGARVPLEIDGERLARVRSFCQAQQITPFMFLMGCYQLLLARYCGTDDVAVGFPIASRERPELESMVGLFANTLVLRTRPYGRLSVRDYLAQVRDLTVQVYDHADMPFDAVVDMVQPQRSLAHSPVFQVMFNLQNMAAGAVALPGLDVQVLPPPQEGARFDLTLVLREGETALSGILEYATDLFDEATVARMAQHYLALLDSVMAQPDCPVAYLPLVTPGELPCAASSPETSPVQGSVLAAFEAQAERQPEALAVVAPDGQLTYGELNARASQLAHQLAACGISGEERVGLLLPRSRDTVVATLAVLKAGAAFVPLDPTAPSERLRHALGDARIRLVLTTQALRDLLQEESAALCLDALDLGVHPTQGGGRRLHPRQLAYAIYTSGTTGRPKAALVEHAGWGNLALSQGRAHDIRPGARVLQLVSNAFDVAAGDMAMTLANGATLVIASDAARGDVVQLHELLRREAISHVQIPVALLAHLEAGRLPALRVVVAGGEEMPGHVRQRWAHHVHLSNAYGPTETTVMATFGQQRADGTTDIGRPLDGVRIHVLDSALQRTPIGVYGEIYVGGAGVGRGYLDRAGLSAAMFLPEIDPAPAGARMYRTGDIGRWRDDGRLEIRGRADHQVKLRGYRIELGEIESVLRDHAQVRDAVVVLREDRADVRQLVAYLVAKAGGALDCAAVQAHARSRLMGYMVPSAWVVLATLPLTANGKVDRGALPAPTEDSVAPAGGGPESANPAAAALVAVWSRLLGREAVGLHDNFFELGGDSILSIQAVALAARAGWKITPKQVFECQTIESLAAVAVPAISTDAEQGEVVGEVPFTPIQRWFLETVDVQPTHWNQGVLLQPSDEIEFEQVALALGGLQQHHDALRLRITRAGQGWCQYLAPADQVTPLREVVLDAATPIDFAEALADRAADMQAGFAFDGSPLFAAVWFRSKDACQRRLWLFAHHMVVDAVSWRILVEDLQTLLITPRLDALPAKTSSLRAWALRMHAHAQAEVTLAEAGYWEAVREPFPAVPLDRNGPNREDCVDKVTVELSQEETALLQRRAASGGGINEWLLTALAMAWRAWTGFERLLVALEGHGRDGAFDDIDLSRTVGWFTLSHPLALELQSGNAIAALEAVRAQLAAVPRKGLGYGLLRGRDRGVAFESAPLSFNYLGQFDNVLQAHGSLAPATERTGSLRAGAQTRAHEIDLVGAIAGGILAMDLRYSRERLDHSSVQAFAGEFISCLRRLLAECVAGIGVAPAVVDGQLAAQHALLALRPEGHQSPLFCVHPAGGSAACYLPLAQALEDGVPVYGLQAPVLGGGTAALGSFEAMAAYYIAAIRMRQPHGPYRLLGWSQGGVIAYEISRQLQLAGEEVELLALVDSAYAPQMLRPAMNEDEALEEQLRQSGFVFNGPGPASGSGRLRWLIECARSQGLLSPSMDETAVRRLLAMQREILQAAAAYRPGRGRVEAVLFHAADAHLFGHLGQYLGWEQELARDWQHVTVGGDHFSCVQAEHVTGLAKHLRHYLACHRAALGAHRLAAVADQEPA